MLGELDREATTGGPVKSREKPFNHTLSHKLQPAEARDLHRIEQIQAGAF